MATHLVAQPNWLGQDPTASWCLLSLCLDRIEDKSGDLYLLLRRNSESVPHR